MGEKDGTPCPERPLLTRRRDFIASSMNESTAIKAARKQDKSLMLYGSIEEDKIGKVLFDEGN